MIKVFENFELSLVGRYQSVLEAEGIRTLLKNQFVSGGLGDIPFVAAVPELWLIDDKDAIRARELIKELEDQDSNTRPDWTCSNCDTRVGGVFDQCWKCGTHLENEVVGETSPNR